jgi:hypothetical protein
MTAEMEIYLDELQQSRPSYVERLEQCGLNAREDFEVHGAELAAELFRQGLDGVIQSAARHELRKDAAFRNLVQDLGRTQDQAEFTASVDEIIAHLKDHPKQ